MPTYTSPPSALANPEIVFVSFPGFISLGLDVQKMPFGVVEHFVALLVGDLANLYRHVNVFREAIAL
jgi:hypothetical protein